MNKNAEVDQFLQELNHPMHAEIDRVREIILAAHPEVQECIKWKSPTFTYKGNMASFFMNAKKHVSLMFHKGALLADTTGLLQGDGKEGRTAKFADMADIESKKTDLEAVVLLWVGHRDEVS